MFTYGKGNEFDNNKLYGVFQMNMNMSERIINLNEVVCNGSMGMQRSEFDDAKNTNLEMLKNAYKNENGTGTVLGIQYDFWPYITFHVQTENAYYTQTINYIIYSNDTFDFWFDKIKASNVKNRKTMNIEKKQIHNTLINVLNNY